MNRRGPRPRVPLTTHAYRRRVRLVNYALAVLIVVTSIGIVIASVT